MIQAVALAAASVAASKAVACAPAGAHLSGARLSAVCTLVAVAIGIVVAYLTLDRFRYHKKLLALLDQLSQTVGSLETLIVSAEGKSLTQVEKNYVALHYLCGTTAASSYIKQGNGRRATVFNGGLDSMLSLCVGATTQWRLDRRISVVICAILCAYELVISFILFRTDDPPLWLGGGWAMWLPFVAVVMAYIAPVVGFMVGEYTVGKADKAVRRWIEEETTRQARAAGNASLGNPGVRRRRSTKSQPS